ncbi:unnamed protein product, partial [Sphagnum balticum]
MDNAVSGGVVRVQFPTESNPKAIIYAQAMVFPVLIHELVKGVMELISGHGLPKNKRIGEYVINKADFLAAELWDMRLGPAIWEQFTEAVGGDDFNLKHQVYAELVSLPVKEFNTKMREIMAGTKEGKKIVKKIVDEVKAGLQEDEFNDAMGSVEEISGTHEEEKPKSGYTFDEIFGDEYAKCLASPVYAIETYLETFDKTQEGFVPFKLFPRQKEIIYAYESHKHNLVTKPRQAGVSTTTAAYMAIKLALADKDNPENVLIIANKQALAFEFLAKIKDFLGQLPRWLWGPDYYGNPKNDKKSIFTIDSKQEIKLPNGGRVKAVATSKDALRGFTPTYLIMDEAAYIDNGAEVFGAAFTALGTGGRAILISTPRGMDELYYKTYDLAKQKQNGFNIIEMKWYEDLRYNKDLRWYKGDVTETETEFTFKSYENRINDGWKPTSSWYEQMCEVIGHQYIMGVDVSRGDGEDSSTIVIVDFTTMEQVLEYKGKIQPDLLAQLVEEYGEQYKAYTVVDTTGGMGVSTVLKLMEFNYKRLHYDSTN